MTVRGMAPVGLGAAAVIAVAIVVVGVVRPADRGGPALPDLPAFPVESMEPTVRRQFDAARDRLGEDPLDAEANGALGMLYHAYGFYALAEPCYRRAARLAEGDSRWRYYLGRVLVQRGDWNGAAAQLDRVLTHRPDHVAALLARADADRRRNRLDEALAGFRRAIELSPALPRAHCGAGTVAFRRGDLEAALGELQEAVRLAPEYGTAHYVLGQALRKLGRLDEARAQLALAEAYRDREPPVDDPLMQAVDALRTGAVDALHRGVDLSRQGRYEPAIELLRESIRIDPALAEAHAQLGAALLAVGDLDAARPFLERAIELEPHLADAHYNLGLLEHRLGAFDRAVEQFEVAADLRPDHYDAHLGLGTDLPHLGRDREAVVHLRTAVALRPYEPRPYKRLGRALAAAGDCDGAVTMLRTGTHRLPRDASVADRLAWTLATCPGATRQDAAEALRIADAVCAQTASREPRALATRAAALAVLGRREEAIEAATQAAALARRQGKADLVVEIEAQLQRYRAAGSREPSS
jgi:tetratricopeptide (TPR) repeat protein